jgi:hypothetical protein
VASVAEALAAAVLVRMQTPTPIVAGVVFGVALGVAGALAAGFFGG